VSRLASVAAALAGLAACSDDIVAPGVIEVRTLPRKIAVPTSALVGEPVHVELATYGGGCASFERTDVEPASDGFDITPFDREPRDPDGCQLILRYFAHDVSLTFDTPGTKTIRVHGVRDVFPEGEMIVVPATIDVQ
jgi:hypothetical protein